MSFILPGLKGSTGGGFQVINLTVAANGANYNVYSQAVSAGGISSRKWLVNVTINSGVYVYSLSTADPAFSVHTGYPTGSVINIINNGLIYGAGGDGGDGAAYTGGPTLVAATVGGAGGTAFKTVTNCNLTNNGVIAGGGGGGGGGGAAYFTSGKGNTSYGGGGGGGGRGRSGGAAGTGGNCSYGTDYDGSNGTAGSISAAGSGGAGGSVSGTEYGGTGGNGGALGTAGSAGQDGTNTLTGFSAGKAGGAAGKSIQGNSYITFIATGTITGPQTTT